MNTAPGRLLVVDDNSTNRTTLQRLLVVEGYIVESVASGPAALSLLAESDIDVVLLDYMMPGMDGVQVLQTMLADPVLREIPVLMVSAIYDVEPIVKCIELGAVDYITKPFEPVVLHARVRNCVEKRRMRAIEAAWTSVIEADRNRTRSLIYSMLPTAIAERMLNGERNIADLFQDATVVFADICSFTEMASKVEPGALLQFLNGLFSAFDAHTAAHGLERTKTIGDAYMAVAGVPVARAHHAQAAADLALALRAEATRWRTPLGEPVQLRIGLHSGPVVAGVIGQVRLHYDLWGDTVNIASRMESHALPDTIQITAHLRDELGPGYVCESRGLVDVKGKGEMSLYWLHAATGPARLDPGRAPQ